MMDLGQKMANDILSICIPYIESLSSFSCDWLKKKKKWTACPEEESQPYWSPEDRDTNQNSALR